MVTMDTDGRSPCKKESPTKVNGHDIFSAFDVNRGMLHSLLVTEPSWMSSTGMGKETAVCVHSGILVHHKEEWNDVTNRKVDEAGDSHIK